MKLSIWIDPAGSGHDDITFSIPAVGVRTRCDTYYYRLGLQDLDLPINETSIAQAVASLLNYWSEHTSASQSGNTLYLPFAFWDEGIECLEVKRKDISLHMTYGMIPLGGWSVNPLKLGDFCNEVKDFTKFEHDTFEVTQQDFLAAVQSAISTLGNGLN